MLIKEVFTISGPTVGSQQLENHGFTIYPQKYKIPSNCTPTDVYPRKYLNRGRGIVLWLKWEIFPIHQQSILTACASSAIEIGT